MLQELREIVGNNHVLTDPQHTSQFTTDWTGHWHSTPVAVVRPANTREVQRVVRVCGKNGIAIVAQGGNTGLVGGGVGATVDHIILSTTRMREISNFDGATNQLTVSAGYTLAEVQAIATKRSLNYGVDLAARDSATIGGTVATNAGGIRVGAYGMTRRQVVGLELVLSDGSVISRLSGLQKDNTGLDLGQLAIGSEGTLGIITTVVVQLHPKRAAKWTALIPVETISDAIVIAQQCGAQILAAEIMKTESVNEVAMKNELSVVPSKTEWQLLLEGDGELPNLTDTALVAEQQTDSAKLWMLREGQSDLTRLRDNVLKVDVSVPVSALQNFVNEVIAAAMAHGVSSQNQYVFGHLLDGNLHFNFVDCANHEILLDQVMNLVVQNGGAISAEHGVGRAKNKYLALTRDSDELALLHRVRTAFDPAHLMNPGVLEVSGAQSEKF